MIQGKYNRKVKRDSMRAKYLKKDIKFRIRMAYMKKQQILDKNRKRIHFWQVTIKYVFLG